MHAISRYFDKVTNWVNETDSLVVGMLRLYAISFILLIPITAVVAPIHYAVTHLF